MNTEEIISVGLAILILLILIIRCHCVKVYRFYRPTCSYCVSSQAEWDSFKTSCLFKMIRPIDVNLDSGSESDILLSNKFKVETVPTVIKVDTDGYSEVYNGERTAVAYMAWASK